MTDDIEQAERELQAARARLSTNVDELKGWLGGHFPVQARSNGAQKEAQASEDMTMLFGKVISLFRTNPAPALLIAIGAGWLIQQHFKPSRPRKRRARRNEPRRKSGQTKDGVDEEMFSEF